MLVVESEVALDLGCKYCARVYVAIWQCGGIMSQTQIMRDTGMRPETVKKHLGRLLTLKLVKSCAIPGYRIVKVLDSVKKMKREVGESE